MASITISRQLGSLGDDIAQIAAHRLGWQVIDRELINQAAFESCSPEMVLTAVDELGLLGIHPSKKKCQAYLDAVERILHQRADEGNLIILGRAGQIILRGRPDVLHIRLHAPRKVRIARISSRQNISAEAALEQIKASDRHRRWYLKHYYHAELNKPRYYDLEINTARLTAQAAADLICLAASLILNLSLPHEAHTNS